MLVKKRGGSCHEFPISFLAPDKVWVSSFERRHLIHQRAAPVKPSLFPRRDCVTWGHPVMTPPWPTSALCSHEPPLPVNKPLPYYGILKHMWSAGLCPSHSCAVLIASFWVICADLHGNRLILMFRHEKQQNALYLSICETAAREKAGVVKTPTPQVTNVLDAAIVDELTLRQVHPIQLHNLSTSPKRLWPAEPYELYPRCVRESHRSNRTLRRPRAEQ